MVARRPVKLVTAKRGPYMVVAMLSPAQTWRRLIVSLCCWQLALPAVCSSVRAEPSVRSQPSDPGEKCEQDDNSPMAIRACSALIAGNQIDAAMRARIYLRRANAWLIEEEPAAAVSDFSRAIAFDANNAAALAGRAKAHGILGEHDLAAADWSRVTEISPTDEAAYLGRAAAQLARGQTSGALADYSRAIDLNPKNRDAYLGRASVYDALNDHDNALAEFAAALKVDPAYVPAHLARAQAAERWGKVNLAIESYSDVLRYNGVHITARNALFRLGTTYPPTQIREHP